MNKLISKFADMEATTVSERILQHLAAHADEYDGYFSSPALTQAGISSSVNISRPHVASELRKLRMRGLVSSCLARIKDEGRQTKKRQKIYAITESAEKITRYRNTHSFAEEVVRQFGEEGARRLIADIEEVLSRREIL